MKSTNNNGIEKDASLLYTVKCGAASFISTCISGGMLHPLELIKTRFQSHDGKSHQQNLVPKYRGIINAIKQILQKQKIKGLYKGFLISVLSQAIAISLFFSIYQNRKEHFMKNQQTTSNTLFSGVLKAGIQASMLVSIITQPLWVIKTRMLLNVQNHSNQLKHVTQKIREIYHQNGLKGFYKGLQINLLLSFSGATQMLAYEGSKFLYDFLNIPQTGFLQKNFICGGIAKIGNVIFTYPLTTLRTRIQQNQFIKDKSNPKYRNILQVAKKTWSGQGIRGFYKGISANILRGIPERGIYFYCYQILKSVLGVQSTHVKNH